MTDERPSKKQHEVLDYIDGFIRENGFGPSYREMMRALGLKSVSTVAAHVDSLIAKGFLVKRENSARSLQVISKGGEEVPAARENTHLAWLRQEITKREADEKHTEEVATLKAALNILDQSGENSV